MYNKKELEELKKQQKQLLDASILDLQELNKVNTRLYELRRERYLQKLKKQQELEEQKQLARINAIFEK